MFYFFFCSLKMTFPSSKQLLSFHVTNSRAIGTICCMWHGTEDRARDSCASQFLLSQFASAHAQTRWARSLQNCERSVVQRTHTSQSRRSVTMIFSIPPIDSHPACITLTTSFQQVRKPDRRCPAAECTGEKEDWWHHRTLFWKISSVAQVVRWSLSSDCSTR